MFRTFYPDRPWPGTHEPTSPSGRVAQRFERSENAIDVVAGLIETSLHPYHTVWFICFILRNFYPSRPWPGTHEPTSSLLRVAQRFERSENALDVVAGHTIRYCIFFCVESFLAEQVSKEKEYYCLHFTFFIYKIHNYASCQNFKQELKEFCQMIKYLVYFLNV